MVSHANDDIDPKDELVSQATIQTFGTYGNLLKARSLYRISPRLVDFNLARTLLNLVTLDFMEETTIEVPFVSLVTDPQVFAISPTFGGKKALDAEATINQRFNELTNLGVSHAASLTLKSSQRRAARRVIGSRLRYAHHFQIRPFNSKIVLASYGVHLVNPVYCVSRVR